MSLTGAQAVVKCLEREGVEYIFGMVGHANLPLFDALNDSTIQLIAMPHEQLAAHAADAYFRVSHKPGVVTTTIGPGLSNAVTGIMDAAADTSAMVVLSGNVPTSYRGFESFQEFSMHYDAAQVDVVRPIVKRAWQVLHPDMLTHALARAFNFAVSGRPGPVLVDVPFDLYARTGDYKIPNMPKRRPSGTRIKGDEAEVERAAGLLRSARRPLIFAGNGVLLSEASKELETVAEYLAIPVVTSMTAHGAMRTDHPLYAGFTGSVGTPAANDLAKRADVVLALGTRFNELTSNSWLPEHFFPIPETSIIQVDIQPEEVGKIYETEVGIVGDVKAVLEQLLEALQDQGPRVDPRDSQWVQRMEEINTKWTEELAEIQQSDANPIEIARLLKNVRDALPKDGIIVGGVGPRHAIVQQFPIYEPRTCLLNNGHGTMGFSVPAALGAKLAAPDKTVICVTGDGEFRSVSQILAPAVEYGINVVWLILNNYGFNIIDLYQKRHYERRIGTEFKIASTGTPYNPDFTALARAYGAEGQRVERPEDLPAALDAAFASDRPYILDVLTTPQPRIRATGYWDANRFLRLGFNEQVSET
ncbi:MAG: thiamine pyrophosphate-binding protein [Ardenticatenaceae bacterium]|nr:thiamine pyrophosphate-binding protein [Ardenticatenaceae bacterium]